MVESKNSKLDLTIAGSWFRGITSYGKIMIGDQAFEFYNDKNVNDYVQIPWAEITYVVADVRFGGRYIPRFEIRTKQNGNFVFAAKDAKKTLRAMRKHLASDRLRRSLTTWQKLKKSLKH
jgi:hypothetical protein